MTTQSIIITTFSYGATPLTATLRNADTDALVATADSVTETASGSGIYVAVFGEVAVIAAGVYRIRAVASGSPINRYVTLTGVDLETATSRDDRNGDLATQASVDDIPTVAEFNARTPSSVAATKMTLVYDTHFATNYDSINKAWLAKLGDFPMGGTGNCSLGLESLTIGHQLQVNQGVIFGNGAPNGVGLTIYGTSTGQAILIRAGQEADAITIDGGTTSGRGIVLTTTDGHGIEILAAGVGQKDIVATEIAAIQAITDALGLTAAQRLAISAGQMLPFTVDTVVNSHTPTTTVFQADDVTEATADHYKNRVVIWTSGALVGQIGRITSYQLVGGIGQFTISAQTESPANNDTGLIV